MSETDQPSQANSEQRCGFPVWGHTLAVRSILQSGSDANPVRVRTGSCHHDVVQATDLMARTSMTVV